MLDTRKKQVVPYLNQPLLISEHNTPVLYDAPKNQVVCTAYGQAWSLCFCSPLMFSGLRQVQGKYSPFSNLDKMASDFTWIRKCSSFSWIVFTFPK